MESKYYNGVRLLNADCPINFSIGNRSAGKSYYWKRYCLKRFIKYGEQFIYLRRYDNELEMALPFFFIDIAHEFPEYRMTIKGAKFTLHRVDDEQNIIESRICGFAFALTTIHKVKSMAMENVNTIFFDEFIPDNGKYIKPSEPAYEPQLLLSLYMTVARGYGRPIREEVKIICAANAVTFFSPFFSYFNIDLTNQSNVICNNVYAERFVQKSVNEEIRSTKFGAILEKTIYGQYAMENMALNDSNTHICRHPKDSRVLFEFYLYKWYLCYFDPDSDCIFFGEGYDKTLKAKFKVVDIPNCEEVIPWFKGKSVDFVRSLVLADRVYYESMKIKAMVSGLFM